MTSIKRSKFHILTVNDVYELEKNEFGVGGMAELNTMIKEKKKHLKDCIVTLNGDFLSASALAIKLKGTHMIDILNTMPFDLISIGNHEFDFGWEVLVQRMGESKKDIKYLNSNIFETESNKLLSKTEETHIMTLEDGTKVGFFAVCTQKTPELSKPGNGVYFEGVEKSYLF
jgi:2',3'-cyclic-nucleotide 2'-phosphodiesterase (5'-nucleotidase family)